MTLEHLGRTLIEARNGTDGLALFHQAGADLVITEIVMPRRRAHHGMCPLRKRLVGALVVAFFISLGSLGHAAEFTCASGNVDCLITAIRAANGLIGPSTILLTPGTFTLTVVDNDTGGPNGLPSVTNTLTIQGSNAQSTIIERAADAPDFRLVHVAPTGTLTVQGLTLQRGTSSGGSPTAGGGVFNDGGQVTISRSRLAGNRAVGTFALGGGLFNNLGTVILDSSTLADNVSEIAIMASGGGLATNGGSVTIRNSTIVGNRASGGSASGGGIAEVPSGAPALGTIVNSTIAANAATGRGAHGGGLSVESGRWTIISSTIAGNTALGIVGFGGGFRAGGVVTLQNTIVAQNVASGSPECSGPVISLGHNVIEDPMGCTVALQPQDRTGSPGLAIYTDDGTPGRGHWPLLPTSQALDAADAATCPPTDQLGRPRVGICDLGAAEFYPAPDPLAAFVTGFYRYALGREPSPTEVAGWLTYLQADPTLDRARVMTHAFFDGPEYRARPVTPESHVMALYRAILGRDPEPAGLNSWIPSLLGPIDAVPRLFVRSPEFQALAPCHDTDALRAFVTRLYQKALGRSPALDELNLWVSGIIQRGCDIENAVLTVLSSEEYLGVPKTLAEHVTILYRALLGREPGAGEVEPWVEYLAVPFIEDQFIESSEFATRWQQLIS